MSRYTCSGCGQEWVWFCGGPETIKYPMTHTCDECGAETVQEAPPGWIEVSRAFEPPKLDPDWDD